MGIDVGGTFTDFALCHGDRGLAAFIKVPTTPDQADGVMAGIEELPCQLKAIDRIVHGTTVGTNAMLQRQGAKVGLITTEGFRDLIEIGRTQRLVPNSMFKPGFVRPQPLVPRHLRYEVKERTLATGRVLRRIDPREIDEIVERLKTEGIQSIAICFLHSYRNPGNEKEAGVLLGNRLAGSPLSLSSEVVAEYREFERFSSTVVNAYLAPVMVKYLESLECGLENGGYGRDLFVMSSSGGMITSRTAKGLPIRTILSGPAGGVEGAIHIARQAGFKHIITYDMGGTSTDVCLVQDLTPMASPEHQISGIPIKTLQMDINAVGAGGGSIAWIDDDGRLRVGPQSAGADPGPAAYGRGGERPTVTDANLVLGRLGASSPLGGKIRLFPELAAEALRGLADRLGRMRLETLAEGIVRIGVARMVGSIREISIEKGHDPRDYVLVAYGGAGPMHAAEIGAELGIRKILIPRYPGNLSAFGLTVSDVEHEHVESWIEELRAVSGAALERKFQGLEEKGLGVLCDEGFERHPIQVQRTLDLRYRGQAFELSLPVRAGDGIGQIERSFHRHFRKRYGHHHPDKSIELVNLRVSSRAVMNKPPIAPFRSNGTSAEEAIKDRRPAYFKGRTWETPVLDRELLPVRKTLSGPAIIEEAGATTIVPPGWTGEVDPQGHLILKRGN